MTTSKSPGAVDRDRRLEMLDLQPSRPIVMMAPVIAGLHAA